jgi:uncharacterized protein (DUF305 family)
MRRRTWPIAALAAVAALAVAACGDPPRSTRRSVQALNQRAVWNRYAVAAEPTAEIAEDQILVEMIAHHADAIGASQAISAAGSDAGVVAFAQRLARVQSEQVTQMEQWLAEWYPGSSAQATWTPMFDGSARAADDAYLTVMIAHHEHALAMYQQWSTSILNNDLGVLMSHIAHGQEGEIAVMRQMLGPTS